MNTYNKELSDKITKQGCFVMKLLLIQLNNEKYEIDKLIENQKY